jgi:hypothetical protein
MKNIAVLIDFTEGSKVALKQAAVLAKKTGGTLVGIHIVPTANKVQESEKMLSAFMTEHLPAETPFESAIGEGNLLNAVQDVLKTISADLVIICTHGVKGMVQHLFGAQILKLVQELSYPCIVIQENNTTDLLQAGRILLPVGPHPDFMIKVKQTAAAAMLLQAAIVLYEINRPGSGFENLLDKHSDEAKVLLEEKAIPYTSVIEEMKVLSVGYSRQTLEYASQNGISVISQMSTVSKNDMLFGSGDKENFLVNEQGISILTCNT